MNAMPQAAGRSGVYRETNRTGSAGWWRQKLADAREHHRLPAMHTGREERFPQVLHAGCHESPLPLPTAEVPQGQDQHDPS